MAVQIDTGVHCTLLSKNQLLKTFRNKLADAGAHSFHFKQVLRRSVQRWQSYQPDEERMQTDRQTAFQLYIVEVYDVI